jgi:SAM-dependent methyltransferase
VLTRTTRDDPTEPGVGDSIRPIGRSTDAWRVQHASGHRSLSEFPFLYHDWIFPNTLDTFRDKDVLDAGSGPGVQMRLIAATARTVTAVDLEALDVTAATTGDLRERVEYVREDIATMVLGRQFDVVNCVGVIHHTDSPTATFRNLYRHLKPGGRMIIWAYAAEGNGLMQYLVEPLRKRLLDGAGHRTLWGLSSGINAVLYPIVHTLYRLPLSWLPYYDYFDNYRRLSFSRNSLNIYDKLNAPQQHFISRATIDEWFNGADFDDVHISHYKGVSWRASGTRKPEGSSRRMYAR